MTGCGLWRSTVACRNHHTNATPVYGCCHCACCNIRYIILASDTSISAAILYHITSCEVWGAILLSMIKPRHKGGRVCVWALVESIPLKKWNLIHISHWLTQARTINSSFLSIVLGGAPPKIKIFTIPTTTLKVGSSCQRWRSSSPSAMPWHLAASILCYPFFIKQTKDLHKFCQNYMRWN